MHKSATYVLPVLLAVLAPQAAAQSISPAWDAYRNQGESGPVPAQEPAIDASAPPAEAAPAPAYRAPAPAVPPPSPASWSRASNEPKGGFFLGAQAGKGWIYEDVDQNAASVHGGYRWQAGSVSLVGVELASGRLSSTEDDGWLFPKVSYGSIGANARFNFGAGNPWFAIARLGYWTTDSDEDGDVDGAYASFGIGVDVNRHFNVSLLYTGYAYATTYYYGGNGGYYEETEVNRADTLMFGVEARF